MDDFFKSENLSYENSKTNEFKFYYLLFQNDLKKFKLYYQYKKQVEAFDVSKKYIYFPLHYQPEATNYPYGDIFIDQANAIKMLSMHLPSEYVIYIKEHPDTFNISRKAWVRGAFNRSLDYYTDLKKIHNVKIIPMETDVTKVIDNSVAISTLTGSTGLEAVIRSKPALVFGYPWYEDCDYVYSCRSHEECKEAINKVINLKAFNSENVNNFFTKINFMAFATYTTKELLKKLKKQQTMLAIQGVVILLMLVFSVFSSIENGLNIQSFLPLFFAPMLFVMLFEVKKIKKELSSRT